MQPSVREICGGDLLREEEERRVEWFVSVQKQRKVRTTCPERRFEYRLFCLCSV